MRISIYNIAEYLVQRLYLGTKLARSYLSKSQAAYWDGQNNREETVSSGICWYELDTGSLEATR